MASQMIDLVLVFVFTILQSGNIQGNKSLEWCAVKKWYTAVHPNSSTCIFYILTHNSAILQVIHKK